MKQNYKCIVEDYMIKNLNKKSNELAIQILHIEDTLTIGAATPFIGSFAALLKIGLGLLQTLCAASVELATIVPAVRGNQSAQTLCHLGCCHMKNGLGNICAGFFEGIPFLGSVLAMRVPCIEQGVMGNQAYKWVKYSSIVVLEPINMYEPSTRIIFEELEQVEEVSNAVVAIEVYG
jgi:hypothetical protein